MQFVDGDRRWVTNRKKAPGPGPEAFHSNPPKNSSAVTQPYAAQLSSQFAIAPNGWIGCNSPTRVTFKPRILQQSGGNRAESAVYSGPRTTAGVPAQPNRAPSGGWAAAQPGNQQHHESRQPDHARAVAVVRIGERAADGRIGEDRERHDRGELSELRELRGAVRRARARRASSSIEPQATGTCRRLIAVKLSSPRLLARGLHGGERLRRERLDDPVGVPDVGVHAVAGGDAHELFGGCARSRLRAAPLDRR